MKRYYSGILFGPTLALVLTLSDVASAAELVTVEAESADVLGSSFVTGNSGGVVYISSTDNHTSQTAPMLASRVASYNVTFPEAGAYDLYARLRVGAGGFDDDSMFYATSFGNKSPTLGSDWVFVNGLAGVGYTADTDVVGGGGNAGSLVWKWINLSQYAPGGSLTVPGGGLTQTFEIGGREDGLEIDKLVFGTSGTGFTVANLNSGMPPSPPTNAFPGPDGIAIHRFSPVVNGINADGANPAAGLAVSDDVLIGTTLNGGPQAAGTAFFVTPDGNEFRTVHAFADAPDAGGPMGELSLLGNRFFTTTFGGGDDGTGAVILGETNGSPSVLHSFSPVHNHTATNSGGASPSALLVLSGDTLYGTTTAGGPSANGAIFSVTTNGTAFSVLHDFSMIDSQTGTNTDGAVPWGGLTLSGDRLYGTASAGGTGGNGVVFSVGTDGSGFTTLHSFSPMDTLTATNTDGAIPYGGVAVSNGTLYGTTSAGGQGGSGTVFSLETNGLGFTALHHFEATDPADATNGDGASPCASLLFSGQVLYGTAAKGGEGAAGTVFSLSLSGAQFSTVHSFAALESNGTNRYGAFPVAPVLHLGNSLYGTTFGGGPGAAGTVFSVPLSASPAVITNILRNAGGGVDLFFVGGPNSTNIIQATGSLAPPVLWQSVSTNVADSSGEWQFSDGANDPTRFYRSYTP